MFTVSLHGIQIHALIGLYPEEKIKGNDFEIDVDVFLKSGIEDLPFVDYTIIDTLVREVFNKEGDLMEPFLKEIHSGLRNKFHEADKIKVCIRKLNPPLEGKCSFAQVSYEG